MVPSTFGLRRAAVVLPALVVVGYAGMAAASARPSGPAAAPSRQPCSATHVSAGARAGHDAHGQRRVLVCVTGTGKADTTVTASWNRRTRQGYAIYQGRRGNTTPSGYVGADTQNGVTVVGCATGTYDPKAKDEWNQRPDSGNNNAQIALGTDEFTAPVGPIGPGDPCSPFVPHTPPGASCGSPENTHPTRSLPSGSPLRVYTAPRQAGITGDFGGGDGASGYLQVTTSKGARGPQGNVTTGGNSRGGGGTVAVGNDGKETDDPFTPPSSPVVVCQD